MQRVAVIGGGAAGLMAAYKAAENSNQVILFEKNEKLGKKIYITGKGRCNFTNDTPPNDFLQNVVRGGKFLYGSLYAFSPQAMMDFMERFGLSIKVERGNRVFPSSDHASDVTKTLEKACRSVGVDVHLNEKVTKIQCTTPNVIPMSNIVDDTMRDIIPMPREVIVVTNKSDYAFNSVIIATGGLSYPSTGSTGDGYGFARAFGHSVTELRPGLCGVNLSDSFLSAVQGITLKNVNFSVWNGEKCVYSQFGELLFTHFGVSGPIVLSASSCINRLPFGNLRAFLDFKPALDAETLDKRLLRDFEKYKNKQMINAMCEILPQRLIAPVLAAASVSSTKCANVLTREERARLVRTLKAFPLSLKSLRGFEEAIITSGGVALGEIDPKTMESKRAKGIYFCGEVLDVDAFTGGYNLQIAFSTGFVAGKSIK